MAWDRDIIHDVMNQVEVTPRRKASTEMGSFFSRHDAGSVAMRSYHVRSLEITSDAVLLSCVSNG